MKKKMRYKQKKLQLDGPGELTSVTVRSTVRR